MQSRGDLHGPMPNEKSSGATAVAILFPNHTSKDTILSTLGAGPSVSTIGIAQEHRHTGDTGTEAHRHIGTHAHMHTAT